MTRHLTLTLTPGLPCAPATGTHCPVTGGLCPWTGPACATGPARIGDVTTVAAAGHGRHVRADDRDDARALARSVTAPHDHNTAAVVLPEAA